MVWKGFIPQGSLTDASTLKLIKIVESKTEGFNIELSELNKEEFISKTIRHIKPKFFIHLVKDKVMYIIFQNHMFKVSRGYPEIETAKNHGKSLGLLEEQMPFEKLLLNPFM